MTTEKSEKVVNNPLEYGMMTLEEFVNLKAKPYKETSFISSQKILYDKGLKIDGHLSRLMQVNNYIARVDINVPNDKDDKPARFITIKPKIAGIIQNPYAVTLHHNNRTNNKEYDIKYEAEIKQADNDDTLLMTVDYDDIANDRLFKSKVKTLSSLLSSEIPEFIANFITKNNPKNIKEYTNSGRIDITGKMDWLWENAAYINGKMHDADKYGNIPIQNNDYIRVSQKTRRLLPHYYPNSKPVEQVVTDLFNNIFESWNGAIEPFLAISFMAMSPYCPEFWPKEGFGTIAFVGDTEAGKSEITGLGLALFGFNKFFMGTTRNTLVGIEQKMNSVNCIPVIVDDISKFKMNGDSFSDELKRLMNGMAREKGKNGQESGTLPPCCPFGFSSNYLPTEKPEIMNRILYLDTENVKFSPEKFNYFEGKGVEELSCILPHILSIGFDRINQIHTEIKKLLLSRYSGISDRMVSQIAIALTGIEVFKMISNTEIKWAFDKLNTYILDCMKRFNETKTPIDKLLEALPTLISERRIKSGIEYELDPDNLNILFMYKTQVCQAYNHYYAMDDSKRINSRKIKEINSENYKITDLHGSHKYQGKNQNSLILDISNSPFREEILKAHRGMNSYQDNTW